MTRQTKILLGLLALLVLLTLACTDLDVDRSEWNRIVGDGPTPDDGQTAIEDQNADLEASTLGRDP